MLLNKKGNDDGTRQGALVDGDEGRSANAPNSGV